MICWGYFISRSEGQGEEINDIYVCMKSQFLLPTVYDFLVKEIRKSIVPHKVLLLFLYHFMGHLMGIHILCFKSRQTTPFY